jgi:soluble lytic murein transglycosylase
VSAHSHSVARRPAVRRAVRAARRRAILRRGAVAVAALAALVGVMLTPLFHHAVREIDLPLRHEDIIRQQAHEKGIDPALIAAVIFAESRFRDGQRSTAGAEGLMQLTPATAQDIARRSGGTNFVLDDLATPQVNISYGAYYLRYLLHRYGGNETFALAAYNGGEGNVDRWIAAAQSRHQALTIDAIAFAETRAYVERVEHAKARYRRTYRHELGL